MNSSFGMPKSENGQGLFIYVLFLLFVVMVVIVFMQALDPDGVNPRSGNAKVMNGYQNPAAGYVMTTDWHEVV